MAELKREYVVPLRRKTRTAPRWRRSKKAVSVLKDFIGKHMKTDNIVLCAELNEFMWKHGIKNPPGKVEVVALKKMFGDSEKTLVNLKDVGVDKQAELYAVAQAAPAAAQTAQKEEASLEDAVQDAEVKEVPQKEEKVEEKPKTQEKKEEKPKKESKKEEVKDDKQ